MPSNTLPQTPIRFCLAQDDQRQNSLTTQASEQYWLRQSYHLNTRIALQVKLEVVDHSLISCVFYGRKHVRGTSPTVYSILFKRMTKKLHRELTLDPTHLTSPSAPISSTFLVSVLTPTLHSLLLVLSNELKRTWCPTPTK